MQKRRWLTWVVIIFGLILLGLIANSERRNILDWVALRNYEAPSQISQLASQTTMTTYARKVFYVNHPEIESKANFSKNCPNNGGEKTVVIGCYLPDQKGIFVLNVDDPRLSGVEQVTAAHEMLHAAYDRLSSHDKQYIDGLLMDYYEHDLRDERIKTVIAAYKQSEPNDVVNEMHSVFGTEVANLPAPLETYYQRYFIDRQKVAAFAAKYQGAFTTRQNQVKLDDTTLYTWKQEISANETSLHAQLQTLNSDQSRLSQLKANRDYADYNTGVPGFNSEIEQYNELVTASRNLISQYNQLVQQRNAIAVQENQLTQEITAEPAKITK